ncbi:MAG: hypothetical protein ACOYN0_14540, partial [Phycisphaerales bacterium]
LRAELEQCRARLLDAPTRADLERIAASDDGTPLFRDAARALCLWLPVCDAAIESRLPMALEG